LSLGSFEPADNCLPCGLFPFSVLPATGSHLSPEACFPRVTVPSQRFPRSQGLSPPATCRPYFMPVPPLGFFPSGSFDSRRAIPSFESLFPLVVTRPLFRRINRCGLHEFPRGPTSSHRVIRCGIFSGPVPLQGFSPCDRLFLLPELFAQKTGAHDPPGLPPP
jgi:hypothetical protein